MKKITSYNMRTLPLYGGVFLCQDDIYPCTTRMVKGKDLCLDGIYPYASRMEKCKGLCPEKAG